MPPLLYSTYHDLYMPISTKRKFKCRKLPAPSKSLALITPSETRETIRLCLRRRCASEQGRRRHQVTEKEVSLAKRLPPHGNPNRVQEQNERKDAVRTAPQSGGQISCRIATHGGQRRHQHGAVPHQGYRVSCILLWTDAGAQISKSSAFTEATLQLYVA